MKLRRSNSSVNSVTFAERAKNFSNNFNVLFLSTITTFGIIISLVALLVAEYTRLIDGLSAIFPQKLFAIVSLVAIGLLFAYIDTIGLNVIEHYNNPNYKEYTTKHSLVSYIGVLFSRVFGKAQTYEVSTSSRIVSRKHLLEYGIVLTSISGNLLFLSQELFGGQDVPLSQAFIYLVENITFNQLLTFLLILMFSIVVIYSIEPFIVYVVYNGLVYLDNKATKAVNDIIEKYNSLGYKTLKLLAYDTRSSLEPLEELDDNYNLLYKINKRDKTISVVNIDKDIVYDIDYTNNGREKSISELKEKLNATI